MKIYDYHGKENVLKSYYFYIDGQYYYWKAVDPSNEMKPNVLYWVSTGDALITNGQDILIYKNFPCDAVRVRKLWKHVMELKKDGMTVFDAFKLLIL